VGNVVQGQQDRSGLMYMRNRYYDPATGRFTQQDPIGLAGGLNLYGFANGDPVNFSDPFGLCPDEEKDANGKCPDEQEGRILTVSANVSASASKFTRDIGVLKYKGAPFGGNLEMGIAVNLTNGASLGFIKGGFSGGAGQSVGVEISLQQGSLRGTLGSDATELEVDVGPVGFNFVGDLENGLTGGGFNGGLGLFGGINFTNFSFSAPLSGTPAEFQRCMSVAIGLAPICN